MAACRRLVDSELRGEHAEYPGRDPELGARLGRNVVIVGGYNEFEDRYAAAVETTLKALEAANVDHVFWLTLRAARHPYVNMNDDLEAAAASTPRVTVIDWNVYSRSHPDWFQDDGIHLCPQALLRWRSSSTTSSSGRAWRCRTWS